MEIRGRGTDRGTDSQHRMLPFVSAHLSPDSPSWGAAASPLHSSPSPLVQVGKDWRAQLGGGGEIRFCWRQRIYFPAVWSVGRVAGL